MAHDEPSPQLHGASHVEDERGDQRDRPQPKRQAPSRFLNLLFTGAVALICGAGGAMGYAHFFGPRADAFSSPYSQTEKGSGKASSLQRPPGEGSATDPGKNPSSPAPSASAAHGPSLSQEANDLKEQVMNLSRRIDRLAEEIERVQQSLSLAVPLLQRIAPKS